MANLIIEKNKINDVILTLSERVTISNPFYLFHLISKFESSEERLFFADNISNNKIRYDEFNIEEISNPDNLNNQVELYTGQWKYTVYQTSVKTLDLSLVDKELETGLLICTDEDFK